MISDKDGLEQEVIRRMHDFVIRDDIFEFPAAKVLLTFLKRYVS
jgi:hypothetical protein